MHEIVIESIGESPQIAGAEEVGILAGLDELDAGRGIPLADVVREARTRIPAD